MDFKIGEIVLCVKSDHNGIGAIKGNEYKIKRTLTCSCGKKIVDVGFNTPVQNCQSCNHCGFTPIGDILWHNEINFVRKSSQKYAETLLEEIEIEIAELLKS